jgi:hypothetical protein
MLFDISWIVAKFMRDNPQGFVNISENLPNAKGRGWIQPKANFRIWLHRECSFTGADKPVMGLFACHESLYTKGAFYYMNSKKLKRILSVALSLSMVLSTNMTGFAADASVAADEDVHVHAEEVAAEDAAVEDAAEEHVHNWEFVRHTRLPNCTKKGMDYYVCQEDGEAKYEYVDALGHDWEREGYVQIIQGEEQEGQEFNTVIVSEASCAAPGKLKHICGVCDVESEEIEYASEDHQWSASKVHRPATCIEPGYNVTECTVCHAEQEGSKEEIPAEPATGHSYDPSSSTYDPASIVVAFIDDDCTKGGTKTKTCKNENCPNEEPIVENVAANADHQWGSEVTTQASCTKKAATYKPCTTEGCKQRSQEVVDESTNPTGHSYNDGVETKAATCTVVGIKTYTCQNVNCDEGRDENGRGKTYTEEIEALGHTHQSEDTTAATCTVVGERTYTCQNTNCDEGTDENGHGKTYTEEIEALGHDYAYVDTTPAKCLVEGLRTYTCKAQNCDEGRDENGHGKSYTEKINALGHDWVDHERVEPTCGTPGTTAGKACSRCDAKEGMEEIPVNGNAHDYTGVVPTVFKPATCTTNGLGKYTCKGCNNATKYDVIPASHAYQKVADDNTASDMTAEEYKTAVEAYLAGGGTGALTDYVNVTKEPGCESAGEAEFTCWKCGADVDGHSKEVTVAATGHDYEDDAEATYETAEDGTVLECKPGKLYATCSNASCPTPRKVVNPNVAPKVDHTYADASSAATCDSPAMKGEKCSRCEESNPEAPYEEDSAHPRLGHTYEQHDENGAVIEGTDGKPVFVEGTVKENEDGTKDLVDAEGNVVATNVTEATCEAPGSATYTCTTCTPDTSEKNTVTRELAQLQHDEDGILHEIKPATCQHNAVIAFVCSQCGKDQRSGDAVTLLGQEGAELGGYVQLDHTWGDPEIINAPNCETGRNGVARYTCTECDEDEADVATKIEALPFTHSYEKVVNGQKVTLTGEEYAAKLEAADKDVDDYIQHTLAPTCEDDGRDTYICTDCTAEATGHTTTVTVETSGHDFENGKVVEGTSEWPDGICKPGVGEYECNNGCGETQEGEIPAQVSDHKWITAQATATCEYPAATGDAICEYCEDQRDPENPYTVTSPRLGHSYEAKDADGAVIEGTDGNRVIAEGAPFTEDKAECGVAGKKTYTCTVCTEDVTGHTYEVATPALEHDGDEGALVEATCQKNAILITKCSKCHEVMSEDDAEDILGHEAADTMGYLMKAHKMDDVTIIANPTCTKNGVARYTCSTCDPDVEEAVSQLKVVPAMHSYQELGENGTVVPMSRADYTKKLQDDGKTVADFITEKIPVGCESDGKDTYVCTICQEGTTGHDADVTVEATGHNYDMANGQEVYPDGTCQPGKTVYTCTNGCSEELDGHTKEEPLEASTTHVYATQTTQPTCTAPGMEGSICGTCGQANPDVEVKITAPMTGHDFEVINPTEDGRGEVAYQDEAKTRKVIKEGVTGTPKTAPTCTETGIEVYTCQACIDKPEEGAVYDHVLLATGHDLDNEYVEATCSSNGKLKVTCKNDPDETFDDIDLGDADPINENAHSYKEDPSQSKAPTCTEAGWKYMVCEHNATHVNKVSISARHNWKEEWRDVDSNLVEDPLDAVVGYSVCQGCNTTKIVFIEDGYVYCEDEKKVYEITPESILAAVAPTCTEAGKTAGQKCPGCGKILVAQEVIDALGHDMKWVDITDPSKAACEDRTLQEVCENDNTHKGQTKTEASETPHQYEEKGIDPVNCGDVYKVVKECKNCHQADPDYVVQEFPEIAKKEHIFVDGVCTNCNKPNYATNIKMEIVEEGVIKITAEVPVNDPSMKVQTRGLIFTNKKAYQDVQPDLGMDMVVAGTATMVDMKSESATGISYTINIPDNMRDRKIWAMSFIWFENAEDAESEIIGMSYNELAAQSQAR